MGVEYLSSNGKKEHFDEMIHKIKEGWKRTAAGLLGVSVFSLLWNITEAQIRYSIPEELKEGFVIRNLAKDLDFDISDIVDRKL